jgi:hypothetical protein
MGPQAAEISIISTGVLSWHAYDPKVKADLYSTALQADSGLVLVDPIDLAPSELELLQSQGRVAGVVVTNENHWRAAGRLANKLGVPVYHGACGPEVGPGVQTIALGNGAQISPDLTVVPIEGAPTGEIALHLDKDGGTLVIGDALINFEPYGFTLLPAKYCSDAKAMRRSLPKLLEFQFDRILFAHGTPLVSGARKRLEQMLNSGS